MTRPSQWLAAEEPDPTLYRFPSETEDLMAPVDLTDPVDSVDDLWDDDDA